MITTCVRSCSAWSVTAQVNLNNRDEIIGNCQKPWREISRVLTSDLHVAFDFNASSFIYPGIPRPVGFAASAVGCESPNKLAGAGGAGGVGTVEGAGSAGLSAGLSAFFFRSSDFFLASS
jgi:hypothetical protein